METLIINAKNNEDKELFLHLAKRLKASIKTIDELEDEILGKMIEDSLSTGLADRKTVLNKLNLK